MTGADTNIAPTPPAPRTRRPDRRFGSVRSIAALMLREMESTYGRSPGGYLWAILEPVGAVAIMSFAFSLVLRAPSLGSNFPYFYATGFLPFALYLAVSNQVAAAIRFSRPLLEYPAVTYLDAIFARFLLNLLTHALVFLIVMGGIIYVFDIAPILDWPAIFLAFAMVSALALSVGIMNCFLISRFQVWERVWAVLNRPMFIISAVVFIPEDVPERFRVWLMLNPLAHITSEMRRGFYATYDAVHVDPLFVFSVSLGIGLAGLFLLGRFHKDILTR